MKRWSRERLVAEKRMHNTDVARLAEMEYELARISRDFSEYKERFADQWLRVYEGEQSIKDQEAMTGEE